MSLGERHILKVWLVLILLINALGLAGAILLQNIWAVMIVLSIITIDLYWLYVRYNLKRKPRYPLVPPEGKGDMYLPRTNIPRPVYEDFREMREKKRKFDKIRKMMRKRNDK